MKHPDDMNPQEHLAYCNKLYSLLETLFGHRNWDPNLSYKLDEFLRKEVSDHHYETVVDSEEECMRTAMNLWHRSLKRPDLSEEARVKGALQAYQRQAYAIAMVGQLQALKKVKLDD